MASPFPPSMVTLYFITHSPIALEDLFRMIYGIANTERDWVIKPSLFLMRRPGIFEMGFKCTSHEEIGSFRNFLAFLLENFREMIVKTNAPLKLDFEYELTRYRNTFVYLLSSSVRVSIFTQSWDFKPSSLRIAFPNTRVRVHTYQSNQDSQKQYRCSK